MREFIKLIEGALNEADETKNKDKSLPVGFDSGASKGDVAGKAAQLPGATATRNQTRAAVRAPQGLEANLGRALAQLHSNIDHLDLAADLPDGLLDDEVPDAVEGPTEPQTPQNLPVVINQAIVRSSKDVGSRQPIQPKWHQVKNLPVYLQAGIRALGQMVFAPFTDTPVTELQVLSTFTNTPEEVAGFAAWLVRNAREDDDAELTFDQILPGYAAKVKIFSVKGYCFMVNDDGFGTYIYGWPQDRGPGIEEHPRQLEGRTVASPPQSFLAELARKS